MKFCSKCGKEICDEAVICPFCGCPVNGQSNPFGPAQTNIRLTEAEHNTQIVLILSIVGIVSTFFMGIVGLVCAIISRVMYNKIFPETIPVNSQEEFEKVETIKGRLKTANILNVITFVLFVASIILTILAFSFLESLLYFL